MIKKANKNIRFIFGTDGNEKAHKVVHEAVISPTNGIIHLFLTD